MHSLIDCLFVCLFICLFVCLFVYWRLSRANRTGHHSLKIALSIHCDEEQANGKDLATECQKTFSPLQYIIILRKSRLPLPKMTNDKYATTMFWISECESLVITNKKNKSYMFSSDRFKCISKSSGKPIALNPVSHKVPPMLVLIQFQCGYDFISGPGCLVL